MANKGVSIIIVCILMVTVFFTTGQVAYAEGIDTFIPTQQNMDYQELFSKEFDASINSTPHDGSGKLESLYVSPDGWFTLTFSDVGIHYTDVYDANCNFQYQLSIKESGAVLSTLDITDNNLLFYPVRHQIIVKVNEQGQYLCAAETATASDAIDTLSALHPFDIVISEKRYYFSGKNVLQGNSQEFIVFDLDGNELFAYIPKNGNQNGLHDNFWKLGLYGILIVIILLIISLLSKDHKKRNFYFRS
jgi:hypothetical protein